MIIELEQVKLQIIFKNYVYKQIKLKNLIKKIVFLLYVITLLLLFYYIIIN